MALCDATPVPTAGNEYVMEALISMSDDVCGLNVETRKLRWLCATETPASVSLVVVVIEDARCTFGGPPQESTNTMLRRSGRYVFQATSKMKQITVNSSLADSDCNATPTVYDGQLFRHSHTTLYCVQ